MRKLATARGGKLKLPVGADPAGRTAMNSRSNSGAKQQGAEDPIAAGSNPRRGAYRQSHYAASTWCGVRLSQGIPSRRASPAASTSSQSRNVTIFGSVEVAAGQTIQ